MSPALRLRGLSHRFGKRQALSAVDIEVQKGDVYGLLGLNGAGKSTTIRLVAGLLRTRDGEIEILGQRSSQRRPLLLRRVGVLFEDFSAHPYLSGRKHLQLRGRELGLGRREAARRADEWLPRVGLADHAAVKVRKYSLGMRRRLGLACALVGSPELVLLDEPTNGLDPQGIRDLRELILDLNRTQGVTFVLSSHILGEVEKLCNRVAIIHQGRLRLEGTVTELTADDAKRHRFRVTPGKDALEILKTASGCHRAVSELGPSESVPVGNNDIVSLTVHVDAGRIPDLVRELVNAGVHVHEVAPHPQSLEALFQRTVSGAAPASADRSGAKNTTEGNDRAP